MDDLRRFSKVELIERLEVCQKEADLGVARDKLAVLSHELHVHELELEVQNRELREAQTELEHSRDRYADLYDFAPIGYVSLDARGVIKEINLTGAAMLNCERHRLIGFPLMHFIAKPDQGSFLDHLTRLKRGEQEVQSELRLGTGQAELPVRLFSVTGQDRDHGFVHRTAMFDISALKQAQADLQAANQALEARVKERTAELEEANRRLRAEIEERERLAHELRARMQDLREADRRKNEFLAMLAHELRNPLAPIRNAIEVMNRSRCLDNMLDWARGVSAVKSST